MSLTRHIGRRFTLWWSAVCILLVPLPAAAQFHTTINGAMPALPGDPDKEDTSPMVCRDPQKQSGSRLPGPRV